MPSVLNSCFVVVIYFIASSFCDFDTVLRQTTAFCKSLQHFVTLENQSFDVLTPSPFASVWYMESAAPGQLVIKREIGIIPVAWCTGRCVP